MYIVGKYQINLHSLRNRTEERSAQIAEKEALKFDKMVKKNYNDNTLLENVKFICTSFRNK
jgi:hypothetical protein